ncbi:hypothetical protein HYC85_018686 [Camellia sinensis]|uniref:Squalene cyclase N-terminal domain-containing protein n=1 Tax=Camellia sinensis TaxID=4442 RepID=A0A7J7GV12_CAMSI|nr:hypothetical protein HYC85_018686 [Camellia sinensis]
MPLEIAGEKANIERLYDAVNVLLYLQSSESGGFGAWEPPVLLPAIQNFLLTLIVVEFEHVECTASVIQPLASFLHLGYREKEIKISVTKAISFLDQKQWLDGSW